MAAKYDYQNQTSQMSSVQLSVILGLKQIINS